MLLQTNNVMYMSTAYIRKGFGPVLIALVSVTTASSEQGLLRTDIMSSLNVFQKPLRLFSTQPMTGFYRDGYCRTGSHDGGNHAVAGVVTDEFLDFSASRGNDLRTIGLKGGCKWCLCTARWLEAFTEYKEGRLGVNGVPRVDLDSTEDSALAKVDMDVFRQFAVQKDQPDSA